MHGVKVMNESLHCLIGSLVRFLIRLFNRKLLCLFNVCLGKSVLVYEQIRLMSLIVVVICENR